jgi:hypothetical protein
MFKVTHHMKGFSKVILCLNKNQIHLFITKIEQFDENGPRVHNVLRACGPQAIMHIFGPYRIMASSSQVLTSK